MILLHNRTGKAQAMDLNELLSRHQLALMGAAGARTPGIRHEQLGQVAYYADLIRNLRGRIGVALY